MSKYLLKNIKNKTTGTKSAKKISIIAISVLVLLSLAVASGVAIFGIGSATPLTVGEARSMEVPLGTPVEHVSTWLELQDAIGGASGSVHIILTASFSNNTENVEVINSSLTVYLYGNGHSIIQNRTQGAAQGIHTRHFRVYGILHFDNITLTTTVTDASGQVVSGGIHAEGANANVYMYQDARLTGNGAVLSGGAVWMGNGATFNMFGGEISGNVTGTELTSGGGGVMVVGGSRFVMHAGEIHSNSGRLGGGIRAAHAGTEVIIYNGTVANNTGITGGGIHIATALLEMHGNSKIENNTAINGGGVHMTSARLHMYDYSEIIDNHVRHADNNDPMINTIPAFDSTSNGGGVFAITNSHIEMHGNASIRENQTHFRWHNNGLTGTIPTVIPPHPQPLPAAPSVTGSNLANNANGGGIWMQGGSLSMHDATSIVGNQTNAHFENNVDGVAIAPLRFANGGGVYLQGGTVMNMLSEDIRIIGNITNSGDNEYNPGANPVDPILREQAVATRRLVNGITIGSGAGIYVVGTNSVVNMYHGQISHNVATTSGGTSGGAGVFIGNVASGANGGPASFIMHNGIIGGTSNAYANIFGGGSNGTGAGVMVVGGTFYQHAPARITFNNTSNTAIGGGIHAMSNSTVTLHGLVANNAAGNAGGGISIGGSSVVNLRPTAVVEHNLINTAGSGGIGVVIAGNGILNMDGGSEIRYNRNSRLGNGNTWSESTVAPPTGGGIRINLGIVNMHNGAVIRDNNANNSGGGIWMEGAASRVNMHGGTITNNRAITATANQGGGGVFMLGGRFYQHSGTIEGNHVGSVAGAHGNNAGGGGVRLAGANATFTMNGGSITDHGFSSVIPRGGGVYITAGEFILNNEAQVYENRVGIEGGGFYITGVNSSLTLNSGYIQDNVANRSGGGVYLTNNATFDMLGGDIFRNFANGLIEPTSNGGGGVHVNFDAVFTMDGGTIRGNQANVWGGGAVRVRGSVFNMNAGTIGGPNPEDANQSRYGGAVMIAGAEGIAAGPSTFTMGNDAIIEGNHAPFANGGGGGVYVSTGVVTTLTAGTIRNNTAINGGGLYVWSSAGTILNIDGTVNIIGNQATNGGGVFVRGTYNMTGGMIAGNSASENGGGIFVVSNGTANITNGSIIGNHAEGDGGGIFYTDFPSVPMAYRVPLVSTDYGNLTVAASVVFLRNTAGNGAFVPHETADSIYRIATRDPNTSVQWHPLNNFDINFHGEPYFPRIATITKHLITPEGTPIPSGMTFHFNVDFITWNGIDATNPLWPSGVASPTVPAVTMPVTGVGTTANGVTTRIMDAAVILNVDWHATGVYIFRITEQNNTLPHIIGAGENMNFSDAVYILRVYVGRCIYSGVFYPRHYFVFDVTDDPTEIEPSESAKVSEVLFVNIYTVTADDGLTVTKTVTGDFGDQIHMFQFAITLDLDSTFGITSFIGTIRNASGGVVDTLTFANGVSQTIYLAHGWSITFADIPVGTGFQVTETYVDGYITTIDITGALAPISGLTTGAQRVQAGGSTAEFINELNMSPPTGLNIGGASVIATVALAVLALGAFVAVKTKKARA